MAKMDRCDARGRNQLHLWRAVGFFERIHARGDKFVQENDEILGELCKNRVSRRAITAFIFSSHL